MSEDKEKYSQEKDGAIGEPGEEIKNGLNTKENELPPPRGHKEVCPHPANQVFLLNGWYRCEACNGKWKSKIK